MILIDCDNPGRWPLKPYADHRRPLTEITFGNLGASTVEPSSFVVRYQIRDAWIS